MQGVPDEVEGWDLVGEEFDHKERGAGGDDRPSPEQQQSRWEREMSEAGQQSEDGDRGIQIQSGSEADRGQQREQFRSRDLEDVQHALGRQYHEECGDGRLRPSAGQRPATVHPQLVALLQIQKVAPLFKERPSKF